MEFMVKPVLTVDIVEFSQREGPEQMEAIQALIQMLDMAIPKKHNHPAGRVWSPAGDGGAITFWDAIHPTVDTAIALGRFVNQYNAGNLRGKNGKVFAKPKKEFQLRTGMHSGPVSKEVDFDDRENIWGDGINVSARVLSLAKPGQILASEDFFKNHNWSGSGLEVERIGKWWAKHHTSIVLYNIYSEEYKVGITYSEVEEWFGPLHYPLEQAINTYEAMAADEAESGKAFRAAVISKRLLDLNSQHVSAKEIIESISEKRRHFEAVAGGRNLHDVFFSPLSPKVLMHFFRSAEFKVFERGEIILREGADADSLMMVVSGKIQLFKDDRPMRGPSNDSREEIDISLTEGEIIGEMGLFDPSEKRTATLKASKRTMTLSIDYCHLKTTEDPHKPEDNDIRREVQEHIWTYYCDRTAVNQINTHPLLRILSSEDRFTLLDNHNFLPRNFQEPIALDVENAWDSWIVVVAGGLSVYGHGTRVEYETGDCLGPIRLLLEKSPFSKIEIHDGTHLVRIPWRIIHGIIKRDECFRRTTTLAGSDDKMRYDLI